ncbi:MAG TPA: hypothetical protein VMC83_09290 [Streptosporangiaceae bacterium]|nr:hypothetical protein [Streptosporangiaceae bacterium]
MGVTKAAPARPIGELPLVGGGEAVDLARWLYLTRDWVDEPELVP